ncbi:HipA domain-containing protein [Saprospiraceae bacterium]|nr:HipA domain-containing protein [Saprospiraceae bacterium]
MIKELDRCPGTLKLGYKTYSPSCRRKLFSNKKVDHTLPYSSPNQSEEDNEKFIENRKRISISGVQEKLSLTLNKNKLKLTEEGEQGTHILKPIPRDLKFVDQVPANEHLTMQIANQIYDINTADNAIIFFDTGEQAYITKRFDVKKDGTKWAKEDFASLAGRTIDSHGKNYKYGNISYEEIAEILKKYVGAYLIEIEKFYKLILFNFLFSNGDAHLKNFSLLETQDGDFILSPAYDLLNTRIHVGDTYFALKNGLFKNGSVRNPTGQDFLRFGTAIGISDTRATKIYDAFLENKEGVHAMIESSFLNDKTKKSYLIHYNTRYNTILKK